MYKHRNGGGALGCFASVFIALAYIGVIVGGFVGGMYLAALGDSLVTQVLLFCVGFSAGTTIAGTAVAIIFWLVAFIIAAIVSALD